jgi:hypothetical protein
LQRKTERGPTIVCRAARLEAADGDGRTPLDAIVIDGSRERLENYLTGYRE